MTTTCQLCGIVHNTDEHCNGCEVDQGDSPFVVPPFSAEHHKPDVKYVWWSWHPNYPRWAKSCWEGKTQDEAWAVLAAPFASSMRYYHNKLIREGDGQFTEVADLPCQEMEVWRKIKAQMAYNATREDHTHEARRIAGGKQF